MGFRVEEKGFIFNLIDGNTAAVIKSNTTKKRKLRRINRNKELSDCSN